MRDGDADGGVLGIRTKQLLPYVLVLDFVFVQAYTPALVRLFHMAAPRLGHDLVAEADADNGHRTV